MAAGGPVQILARAHRSSAGEEHGEGLGVTKLGFWPNVRVGGVPASTRGSAGWWRPLRRVLRRGDQWGWPMLGPGSYGGARRGVS
jgi:hypothetical protein